MCLIKWKSYMYKYHKFKGYDSMNEKGNMNKLFKSVIWIDSAAVSLFNGILTLVVYLMSKSSF